MPVSLSPANREFPAHVACDVGYDEEIYHWAAVIYAEARGESLDGKLAVLDALRNGAHGYKVGRLEPRIVELVVEGIKRPVGHPYKHWINFELATDDRQVKIALRALRDKNGIAIGSHFFY